MSNMDSLKPVHLSPPAGPLGQFPPKRWHLALAGGLVAAVYLAGVSAAWWPTPDSALYQGLAANHAAGEG